MAVCSAEGCSPSMLGQGSRPAMNVRALLSQPTTVSKAMPATGSSSAAKAR